MKICTNDMGLVAAWRTVGRLPYAYSSRYIRECRTKCNRESTSFLSSAITHPVTVKKCLMP